MITQLFIQVNISSIINIAGATAGLTFVIRYFETAKTDAINALEEKNEELEKLIVTDHLTGIYNRLKLDDVLNFELNKALADTYTFSIIVADIDNFKRINDIFGHLTGDSVLIDVANILKNSCRKTDIVGRWGGEEFIIICTQTDKAKAKQLCEKLIRVISEHEYTINERITMSFGVTEFLNGDSVDSLIMRADKALYSAKDKGKCLVEAF